MTMRDLGAGSSLVTPVRRRRRRLAASAILGATTVAGVALIAPPAVLVNTTPSEPPGVYLLTGERPAVGRIIAFRLPPGAFAYVDRAMPYLRHRPLLKEVAAGPGDQVCAAKGTLAVNGDALAPIATHDRLGRALPQWSGCRRLGPDEMFVYSSRVPNSFDSRYYGPVSRGAVLGVYRLAAASRQGDA